MAFSWKQSSQKSPRLSIYTIMTLRPRTFLFEALHCPVWSSHRLWEPQQALSGIDRFKAYLHPCFYGIYGLCDHCCKGASCNGCRKKSGCVRQILKRRGFIQICLQGWRNSKIACCIDSISCCSCHLHAQNELIEILQPACWALQLDPNKILSVGVNPGRFYPRISSQEDKETWI